MNRKEMLAVLADTARIYELEAERDKSREDLAALMIRHSFATGHGDTIGSLLAELDWQLIKRRNQEVDTLQTQSLILDTDTSNQSITYDN